MKKIFQIGLMLLFMIVFSAVQFSPETGLIDHDVGIEMISSQDINIDAIASSEIQFITSNQEGTVLKMFSTQDLNYVYNLNNELVSFDMIVMINANQANTIPDQSLLESSFRNITDQLIANIERNHYRQGLYRLEIGEKLISCHKYI